MFIRDNRAAKKRMIDILDRHHVHGVASKTATEIKDAARNVGPERVELCEQVRVLVQHENIYRAKRVIEVLPDYVSRSWLRAWYMWSLWSLCLALAFGGTASDNVVVWSLVGGCTGVGLCFLVVVWTMAYASHQSFKVRNPLRRG